MTYNEQQKTVRFTGYIVKQDNGKYIIEILNPDQIELVRKEMIGIPLFVTVQDLGDKVTYKRVNKK
jgi:hypothetical protein